eukprot:TRINITY_DN17097_c0_g1_i1.p3 TRINITY_DN17097_c0_g1~~TRINITY_DN17097_c0_g1_i1.p3  ORF type:complete len:102 (-),score=6.09 TRINITY_DN17097_c0_g1_i1:65-370(-)
MLGGAQLHCGRCPAPGNPSVAAMFDGSSTAAYVPCAPPGAPTPRGATCGAGRSATFSSSNAKRPLSSSKAATHRFDGISCGSGCMALQNRQDELCGEREHR